MEGQHVILYLDEIDKVSFSFKIYQSAVVKKTKPAAVTVYDYYETGKKTNWRQKGVLYGEIALGNWQSTTSKWYTFDFKLENICSR